MITEENQTIDFIRTDGILGSYGYLVVEVKGEEYFLTVIECYNDGYDYQIQGCEDKYGHLQYERELDFSFDEVEDLLAEEADKAGCSLLEA